MGFRAAREFWTLATFLLAILHINLAHAEPFAPTAEQCPNIDELTPEDKARVRCGMLEVPENHALPGGRKIELAVVILEPKVEPKDEPIVLLHGGPGGGDAADYQRFLGGSYERRTILFDQRGAGRSIPAFCPELGDILFEATTKGSTPEIEMAELVAAHGRCNAALVAEGYDLTQYNTHATVADMESLRAALKLERWNVYGVSYGTAVGLAYLAEHPDRIRALILDSVYPLDAPPASHVVANMMRSLHELSLACAAQPACAARYGNVEALFQKALTGLVAQPLDVPMAQDAEVDKAPTRISASAFLTVIHQLLYDETAYAALPLLIDRVAARDAEVFAVLIDQFRERANAITHGAYAAVECYERFPFDSHQAYEAASAPWPLARDNMTLIVQHFGICANWTARAPSPMTMPSSRANVPVLVMAGGWDPITPPAYSRATAQRLDAFFVEVPYWGHGARGDRDCARPIAQAFLDHPTTAPDASCMAQHKPPLFITQVLRAPAIAREALAISKNALSATTIFLGVLFVVLTTVLIWPVMAAIGIAREGSGAINGFWTRPGVPLGLAALSLLGVPLAFVIFLPRIVETTSPLVLPIGLPMSAWPIIALPWIALASVIWGMIALTWGAGRAERLGLYTAHLWIVALASVGVVLLLATLGLVVPNVI